MVYGRYNELVFMGFINQQTSLRKHHIGAEISSCIVLHVNPFVLLRYLKFWPMFPHVSIIWVESSHDPYIWAPTWYYEPMSHNIAYAGVH